MYVCMQAYLYMFRNLYVFVYICLCMYVCIYVCMTVYNFVCACLCHIYVCMKNMYIYMVLYVHAYAYMYMYIHIYVCVCCISLCRCKLYLYQISSTSLKTIYMPYPQWLEWVLIWRQTLLSFIYTHVLTRHWYVWYVTACKAAHVTVHASETQARTHTHKHLQYIMAAHRACIMTWVCL